MRFQAWVLVRLQGAAAVCTWELACRVPLQGAWASAAAGCRCRVPLQGAAAVCAWGLGCCRVPLLYALGSLGAAWELGCWRRWGAATLPLQCAAGTAGKVNWLLGVYAGLIFL